MLGNMPDDSTNTQKKHDTISPTPADQITPMSPTGKAFAKRAMDPAGMQLQARCPGHSNLALQGRGQKRGEAPELNHNLACCLLYGTVIRPAKDPFC